MSKPVPKPVVRVPALVKAGTEQKACRFCREPIHVSARLCKHCKSDLTWRRHISFSTTSLALCTALVAVVGALGPSVRDAFVPANAKVSADLIGSRGSTILLLLQNSGKAPAGISRAQVTFASNDGRTILADLQAKEGAALVGPGAQTVAQFEYSFGIVKPERYAPRQEVSSLRCDIRVDGVSRGEPLTWSAHLADCSAPLLEFHLYAEKKLKNGQWRAP